MKNYDFPNGVLFWCSGWLFTIGVAKLSFWHGLCAIILWPYELGKLLSSIKLF